MEFTCVNCSRLTAVSLISDDITVYRCNNCDMEYRLIGGCIEKQSAQNLSIGGNNVITETDGSSAMPIRVEIKRS